MKNHRAPYFVRRIIRVAVHLLANKKTGKQNVYQHTKIREKTVRKSSKLFCDWMRWRLFFIVYGGNCVLMWQYECECVYDETACSFRVHFFVVFADADVVSCCCSSVMLFLQLNDWADLTLSVFLYFTSFLLLAIVPTHTLRRHTYSAFFFFRVSLIFITFYVFDSVGFRQLEKWEFWESFSSVIT